MLVAHVNGLLRLQLELYPHTCVFSVSVEEVPLEIS